MRVCVRARTRESLHTVYDGTRIKEGIVFDCLCANVQFEAAQVKESHIIFRREESTTVSQNHIAVEEEGKHCSLSSLIKSRGRRKHCRLTLFMEEKENSEVQKGGTWIPQTIISNHSILFLKTSKAENFKSSFSPLSTCLWEERQENMMSCLLRAMTP